MKARFGLLLLAGSMVSGITAALHGAERFNVFGLEHSLLTNTLRTISTESPLRVENASIVCPTSECPLEERFGVTVHLGEADSGLFAYPDDADSLQEVESNFSGYLLEGTAFGRVDGVTNRVVSSLSVTRSGWGQYFMTVDFSPLGATSYTYEVFSDGIRTLYATNKSPYSGLSTYDIEPGTPPRANPFWRFPDGSGFAAVIELPNVTRFYLEDPLGGVGERLVIRPQGATSRVDFVSHVEIVGSQLLPRFAIQDERIGMFGIAHRVLGGTTFVATNRELKIAGFPTSPGDEMHGVLIEAPKGSHWEGSFRELSLANEFSRLLISAAGTSSALHEGAYYGPAGISRETGATVLQADFSGLSATGVVVTAVLNGVASGSLLLTNAGALGILAVTNPTVLGCNAYSSNQNTAASFTFVLLESTTFTAPSGEQLTGDRFQLSPAGAKGVVGSLKHVVLDGVGLDHLTLTNEITAVRPVPILTLHIERSGTGVTLSWPAVAYIYPLGASDVESEFSGISGLAPFHYADFRYYGTLARLTNSMRYFQLEHYYNHLNQSGSLDQAP